jgi:CBS domain-containing protein
MTATSIMTQDLTLLRSTDTVKDGLRLMHEKKVRTLPVVDEEGGFVGLFGIRQVVHLLLPKAAQIVDGLTDLSFMPDDEDELHARIEAVDDEPVSAYLEAADDLLICEPTTPLPEVLELLHLSFNTSLPVLVVDNESRALVGMVSGWDILEKIVMDVVGDNHNAG